MNIRTILIKVTRAISSVKGDLVSSIDYGVAHDGTITPNEDLEELIEELFEELFAITCQLAKTNHDLPDKIRAIANDIIEDLPQISAAKNYKGETILYYLILQRAAGKKRRTMKI